MKFSRAASVDASAGTTGRSTSALLERLHRLPRESRDTLFLLVVIAWTVVPHLGHLPLWTGALTALVLLWRARLAIAHEPLPGRWTRAGVLLLAAGLTFLSHHTLIGKDPGVTMAVVLMALKTLELRARRDAFVVFFLGFFLILTQFFYSQSLLVAAAMLIAVWGLLTGLVLAHMPVGQPALRHAGWLAARTALIGTPIMVLLFVLFPRIGPLWGVPNDAIATTGLSNHMRMGSIAELAQDESVAMRIRFFGRIPPPQAMYFRGPVLGEFDGREWRPLSEQLPPGFPRRLAARAELRIAGQPVPYEMTLEPLKMPVLPLLEAATEAPRVEGYEVSRRDDLQWLVDRPVFERLRFNATAYPSFRHGPAERVIGLEEFTALPPGYNPRTLQWAIEMGGRPGMGRADARTLAQAVLTHIRTGGYSYSLSPGSYGATDERVSIDEFWIDRRIGFCEHFAAAFVVVMRALDVPARIVTGYQGTDPEPVDEFHIVRQSSAHAWAEYWQAGIGWVRADPTAAVAPDRVFRNARLAAPQGVGAQVLATMNPELLAQFRLGWEAINNRWNQWVLSYSRGAQTDLLQRLGFAAPDWRDLAALLIGVVSVLAALGAGLAAWEHQRVDPWTRQMSRWRSALRQLGIDAPPHQSARALAREVQAALGERGGELPALLQTLDSQRYGRDARHRPDATLTQRFIAEARRIGRDAGLLPRAPTIAGR